MLIRYTSRGGCGDRTWPMTSPIKPDPVTLLPALYEATADREQWLPFLRNLCEQINARVATLIMRDHTGRRVNLVLQAGASAEAQRLYESYYSTIDAFFHFAERRRFNLPGMIAPAQAFLSDKELLATEFCNDFLLRFDWFHHCFALFGKNGVAQTNVSLIRSPSQEPFCDAEMSVLRFLGPHIHQALRLSEQFNQLRMESEGRKAALNQLGLGVIFLDAKSKILGVNAAAAQILSGRDGVWVQDGRLVACSAMQRSLQAILSQCAATGAGRGTSAGGAILVPRNLSRKPLQIVVGPACAGWPGLPSCPAAVVFIHDLSAKAHPRAEILTALYGLTAAEARVACLLASGYSGEEVRGILQISRNTVKTQVRSIFAKTGVRSQAQLVRILMFLPSQPESS